MNRRSFLTAIPAAVAALVASKSIAAATSPVDAPEAIPCYLGEIGTDTEARLTPDADGFYTLESCYAESWGEWFEVRPLIVAGETHPEIIHFASGGIAEGVEYAKYTEYGVSPMTYVAPRGVE